MNLFKKVIKHAFNSVALSRTFISSFNSWYENASQKMVQRIEPSLSPPKFNYTWKMKVGDKIVKFTYLKNESRFIFHFPLSYKKNDPPIKQLEKIIHEYYPPDHTFLDIGANFGLRSLYYLAHKRPCILFEPNSECNTITRRLIEENNFDNCRIVTKMVGSQNASSNFYLSHSSYVSSASKEYVEEMQDLKETIQVEQITIDSFLENEPSTVKATIAKIDVEGFEYEVCEGAKKFLTSTGVSLLIEILPNSKKRQEVFDLLKNAGHIIFVINKTENLVLVPCQNEFLASDGSIDFFATNNTGLLERLRPFIK